jgi:hypothetical protein
MGHADGTFAATMAGLQLFRIILQLRAYTAPQGIPSNPRITPTPRRLEHYVMVWSAYPTNELSECRRVSPAEQRIRRAREIHNHYAGMRIFIDPAPRSPGPDRCCCEVLMSAGRDSAATTLNLRREVLGPSTCTRYIVLAKTLIISHPRSLLFVLIDEAQQSQTVLGRPRLEMGANHKISKPREDHTLCIR